MNHVIKGIPFVLALIYALVTTECVKKNTPAVVNPPIDTSYTGPVYGDTVILAYSLQADSGAALKGYPKLQSLHSVYTGTFDFNNLVRCPLLTHLYLEADTFVNLSEISRLTRLTYLYLSGFCADPGLPGFSALVNLDTLTLYGLHATTDLSALASLPNLEILSLTALPIVSLPAFTAANGSHLRQVVLFNCVRLKDITGLKQCGNLDSLWLQNCGVSDSLIPQMPSVRYLTVVACSSVTSIQFLAQMTNLEYLTINGPISDWSPLAKLVNLEYLDIGGITDLTPLDSLTKLATLNLGDWQLGGCPAVSDISCIANLSNISYLSIKNTAVTNFLPLLTIMNSGDTVWVTWGDQNVVDSLLKANNIDAVTGASMPWNQ
ncbi:MAG TPA: hypothetical protein VKF42_10380 [Chitinivibrionales bacterium]|jgi:Leucine-rich repeat (LRR) protein|nr:hypothetical protein [Chitinivibrionales bacterium]